MESLIKTVRITRIVQEIPDAKSFFLENTDGSPLNYQPGQFLTLVFPKADGTEARRSYSFSTAPQTNSEAAITVKKVDNGEYSRKLLDHVKVGDELKTIGPSGVFTLPGNVDQFDQIIFLAAGSGITPIISLIKSAIAGKIRPKITLIYSNHSEQTTLFYQELVAIQKANPQSFTIEFLFSDSRNLGRARLGKLLLEQLLKQYVWTAYSRCLFFLCGPHDYMRMATIVLQTEGAHPHNIRKENFGAVKPRFIWEPPDKNPHQVTLLVNGTQYKFRSQYPDSILQSAKKAGVHLAYSCESGQCGTCVATCVEGKTWMKNNEVLVDAEVNKGRTLTCTAFPIEGDVTLKI